MKKLEAVNSQPIGSSPEQFRQFMLKEIDIWKGLVRDTGIKPSD